MRVTTQHLVLRQLQKALSSPSGVKVLDLPGSKLTELPEEIGTLTDLQQLIVADNSLRSIPRCGGEEEMIAAALDRRRESIT